MRSSITSSKCHGRDPAPARARLLVTRAHSGVFIDPLCAENAADRARARCDSAAAWSAAVPAAVAGRPARRQAPGRAGRPPSAGETPALHAATTRVALPRRPIFLPPLDVRNHDRLIRPRVPECIDESNALL